MPTRDLLAYVITVPRSPQPDPSGAPAAVVDPGDQPGSSDGTGGSALAFDLRGGTNPNPFAAWLLATGGGLWLFLLMTRRSEARDRRTLGTVTLAGAFHEPFHGPVPSEPVKELTSAVAAAAVVAPTKRRGLLAARPAKAPKAPKPPKPSKAAEGAKTADNAAPAEPDTGLASAGFVAPAAPPVTNQRRTTTNEARSRRDRGNHPTIELVDATADDAPLAAVSEARAAFVAAAVARAADGPQRFTASAEPGVERLTINYRRVRVADGPYGNESRELGRLDRGDEVEVVDSFEGYLQVLAPDGLTGWIPRQAIV